MSPGSPPPGSCVSFSFWGNSPTVGLSRDPLIVSFLLFFNLLSLSKSVHSHGIRQRGDHTSQFALHGSGLPPPRPVLPVQFLRAPLPPPKKVPHRMETNYSVSLSITICMQMTPELWQSPAARRGAPPGVSPLGLHPVALLARLCDPGQLK